MKLSWLDTSEAHTSNTSMYMIWQYESMHKVRERVRESESIANTRIYFKVRAHSSRPRLQTEGFSLTCPHRETPMRIWGNIITGSTQLLSQPNTTSHRGNTQPKHHLTQEGQARSQTITIHLTLEGYKSKLHLSLEGAIHNLNLYQRGSKPQPKSTSTKEGYHKAKGFTTWWYISTTNQFSHK